MLNEKSIIKIFTLAFFICTMMACTALQKDRAQLQKIAHDVTDEMIDDSLQLEKK